MNRGHIKANLSVVFARFLQIYRQNPALQPILVFGIALFAGIILGSTVDLVKNVSAEANISILFETELTSNPEFTTLATPEKVEINPIQQKNEYTEPKSLTGAGILYVPNINLYQSVSSATISSDGTLITPTSGTAVYNGNILYGHSSGVFSGLFALKIGDTFNYNGRDYTISGIDTGDYIEKVINNKKTSEIRLSDGTYTNMSKLSNSNALVLMTCAGNYNTTIRTAEKRLLIFAQ